MQAGKFVFPAFDGPSVHQVSIPTTLSASDFNASAGCTDLRNKAKQSYRHPLLVPRIVILDPAPTVHTPLWVWLSTGIRALDHATEGLCSQFSNPVSDAQYVQALKLLGAVLPGVKRNPGELGLPRRLGEVEVTRERFAAIAAHTMRDAWLYTNPRKISTPEQVLEILDAAA